MMDILDYDEPDALERTERFLHPKLYGTCPTCEGVFLSRLRERLKEPPLLTRHEQVIVVK